MLSHTKYLSLSAAPTHVKPAASQLRSKIWARALRKKLLSALVLGALASLPFCAAASVVFATAFAALLLGETIGRLRWLAVGLTCVGMVIIRLV